jgi:putative phosphoribosyl transferase
MRDKKPADLAEKIVILVDDGIATGNTLISTISMLRKRNPAKIVVAVPVAPKYAVAKLSKMVDELVIPLIPEDFHGVGAFYEDFEQVSDEEVIGYLDKLNNNLMNN